MSNQSTTDGPTDDPDVGFDRKFFGHPKGLANLFGVEMWERFSFYGMQAILTIYLYWSVADGGLALPKDTAAGIVGAYGGTVYLSTVFGAWVADRLFGPERTLFYSGVLILLGHVSLAVFPGLTGVGIGLVLVAIGSGGLKATATVLVGLLYSARDERRDAGFSIFYMGVNLGALVGPLLTGLLQTRLGFHYGFGVAAVGMALGLAQYVIWRRDLPEEGRKVPNPIVGGQRLIATSIAVAAVLVIVLSVLVGWLTADNLVNVATTVIVLAALGYFVVILTSRRINTVERKQVFAFIPLFLASFAFWSLYQQQFTVMVFYADNRVDRQIFGWEIPVAWVNSIIPIFIVTLAPVFAWMWTKLGSRQPSTATKFALGVGGVGLAFLLMVTMSGTTGASVPVLFLVLVLLVFTLAELCLSPVGLSVSTKLAPRAFEAQTVALFYLSVAAGTSVAGWAAENYSADNEAAYFGVLGGIAVGMGVLLAIATPAIRRLMPAVR
ncbi:POT family proton-dependent oligopeptide transporter [Tamaricihabitans halophyticus]|uniref:POT family proton-dependent oligopeptide transporter n=1 Tax=Tamaricihabitans halophyticus TaxID=1262583 RepID=A0A4R2R2T4_9PSEU|nr:oligopeptide:H+ symporter [Tamaricihabitans halophyticus]TCP56863.1 POT family proton-dependent oligopeptide transporter [Tamaricihabitans halophyticus]